ncbi:MAG: UvrD-helicase domain-containing protein, partial [Arenimonas sp.]|nr:UvrD-helicase domain-containing protein [Arenimonas sp.]
MSELPLPYRLPLQGIALIEASAGTGKTHTLIRIIARHVLWEGKPIEQVLAVTFTEAATAELRTRLRDFFNAVEQFFKNPSNDQDIEYLISEAPAGVSETELYLRITQALANIDKASVFTIHGFCQRILNEQPLLTGQSIPSPQFIESQQDIIEQICQEFWRHKNLDVVYCDALQNTWASPAHMQKMVAELLTYAKLTPERPSHLTPPDFELAFAQFKAVFQQQISIAKTLLLLAIEQKTLSGVSHKIDKTLAQFDALTNFFERPNQSTIL